MPILNLFLATFVIVLGIVWIISLVNWDGKCHCDKTECENCPYRGSCEHETEEQSDE